MGLSLVGVEQLKDDLEGRAPAAAYSCASSPWGLPGGHTALSYTNRQSKGRTEVVHGAQGHAGTERPSVALEAAGQDAERTGGPSQG